MLNDLPPKPEIDDWIEPEPQNQPHPIGAGLMKFELILTVLPVILFSALVQVANLVSPSMAVGLTLLGMGCLLPAFILVKALGYKTPEGGDPLPLPDMSTITFVVLIAAHALLVAAAYLICRIVRRWLDRQPR